MDETERYGLRKPGQEDFYDIGYFNHNADVIDGELFRRAKKAPSPIAGNLAAFDENGDLSDSGASIGGLPTADALQEALGLDGYLQKSGGAMAGPVTLAGAPTADGHAASKGYVDGKADSVFTARLSKAGTTETDDRAVSFNHLTSALAGTTVDLNSYVKHGEFNFYNLSTSSTLKNYPAGVTWTGTGGAHTLKVVQLYTSIAMQILAKRASYDVWLRYGTSATAWQPWKKLAYTADIPASLPANGGHADTAGYADTAFNAAVADWAHRSYNGIPNRPISSSPEHIEMFAVLSDNINSAAAIDFWRYENASPHGYAVHFGLDTDNVLKVGGISMGQNAYAIQHDGRATVSTDVPGSFIGEKNVWYKY